MEGKTKHHKEKSSMNHINIQTEDIEARLLDQRKNAQSQIKMGCTDRNKLTLILNNSRQDYFSNDINSTRNRLLNNVTNTSSFASGINQLKVDGLKVKAKILESCCIYHSNSLKANLKNEILNSLSNDYHAYVDTVTKIHSNRQSSYIENISSSKPFLYSKLESLRSSFVYQSIETNNIATKKKISITTKNSDGNMNNFKSVMSPFMSPNANNYNANLLKLEKMNYILRKKEEKLKQQSVTSSPRKIVRRDSAFKNLTEENNSVIRKIVDIEESK